MGEMHDDIAMVEEEVFPQEIVPQMMEDGNPQLQGEEEKEGDNKAGTDSEYLLFEK